MTKINRRYIDKHWMVFIMRGVLAGIFGLLTLFNCLLDMESMVMPFCAFLLTMGTIDAVNAIYNSNKKRGWANYLVDAVIDVAAALALLITGRDSLIGCVVILSVYTIASGVVDLFHAFLSTVDPTDKFIRILVGAFGCISGAVILNAGDFEIMSFSRFFGAYVTIVGVTSLIYGVHNRSQSIEDHDVRHENAHHTIEGATKKATKLVKKLTPKSSKSDKDSKSKSKKHN